MATTLSRQNPEAWTLGILSAAQRSRIVALQGKVDAAAGADRWTTLRQFRATAGYSVPTGFEFLALRVLHFGSVGAVWHFLDGTTDVGIDSAAAPTDAVSIDSPTGLFINTLIQQTALQLYDREYYFTVPAGRFPAISATVGNDGVNVTVFGVERPV